MSALPIEAAARVWRSLALPESALARLRLLGDSDLAVNSSFKLGIAAQTSIGLSGLSSAYFHTLRTGIEQDVSVDARHAVIQFHSEKWYTVDGKLPEGDVWDPIAGLYKTKGDGYVRIHTNFPHHRSGILKILGLPETPTPTREDVSKALLHWDAVDFETEAASNKMCATALRSFDVWDKHPHAEELLNTALVSLHKIGEAPKRQVSNDLNPTYPLEGIRILDLSRVLAGPIAGRALAAQGADVLLITSPNLPSLPLLDMDTSLGKRTTQLDLKTEAGRETLAGLVKDADVFLQAYRPGGLEEAGFGAKELVALRSGIVCANLCAWGWDGPFKERRGFDSLVQTATGLNVAEGQAYNEYLGKNPNESIPPRPFPMQAIDHAAGYLLSLGINAALCRTITDGGSWEVRVSLAAVGQWIRSLGRVDPQVAFGLGQPLPPQMLPPDEEIEKLSIQWHQPAEIGGREMTAVRQAAILSKTPVKEGLRSVAPMGLNVHQPVWL